MKCSLLILLALVARLGAADLDAELRVALAEAGMQDPIRHDLQRPVDARLARARDVGWERSGLFPGIRHVARSVAEVRALSGKLKPGDRVVLVGDDWQDARFTFEAHGTAEAPILFTAEGARFTGVSQFTFHRCTSVPQIPAISVRTSIAPGSIASGSGNSRSSSGA